MELVDAIKKRRSIRKFKTDQIPEEVINELLELSVWAPSGMNQQPWVFSVIQDRSYLEELSVKSKSILLDRIDEIPVLRRYARIMSNPKYDIFYHAPTLLLVYGDARVPTYFQDCSLAAQNLMLLAWEKGLGSCWIGFAHFACDTPEVKDKLAVPEHYELVASIVLGFPDSISTKPGKRKAPQVISWLK